VSVAQLTNDFQVVEGTMEDTASLSEVIARAYIVVSLLGPNNMRGPMPYPGYYSSLFPLMRDYNVKRILGSTCHQLASQEVPKALNSIRTLT
jgi:hypothetical protein